ncbi:UPF0481 protein [Camellia lanceoleosa]|uniref:UPF0481 protein n=1 Tax=Camellia lanceoleosa TaxID=1840588 RepID=A0ACC0HAT3_9ERIC|nr:UPF0481 protein [Camellia lanceoleosa]
MAVTSADHMLDIDRKLAELSPIPSERCIFRVHDLLRNENKKVYEPEAVAIGPYHYGKDNLQPMEEHKLRCLKQLLQRRNERSAERYIAEMRKSEQRAREFYAEPISLDSNAFVEMMLLDSCFIVEFLRHMPNLEDLSDEMTNLEDPNDLINPATNMVDPNDPMANPMTNLIGLECYIENALGRDLLLFENQFPFFIVKQLFDMTKTENSIDTLDNLIGEFISHFRWITPEPSEFVLDDLYINHLLGLLHYCFCYQFHSQRNTVQMVCKTVDFKYCSCTDDMSLKSATELQEAGIKFKKIEGRNLFDIRFVNGTMEIPTLLVSDRTESVFRNLIAYEQYHSDTSWHHFTAYLKLMDYLVNTSNDVKILTSDGIIHNFLGENEVVATMLNKLGNNITTSSEGYEEVYNNVNEHCRRKRNLWLAILRRDYFNNPWALISFLAAAGLLVFTLLQTIFSILSVQKSN